MSTDQLSDVLALLMLVIFTRQDLQRKAISRHFLLLFGTASFGLAAWNCMCSDRTWNILLSSTLPAALLPGTFLLSAAFLTGQKVGYGDAAVYLILGILEGGWWILLVLMAALLLSAAVSGMLLFTRKAGRNTRLPFIPFTLAGFILLLLCEP